MGKMGKMGENGGKWGKWGKWEDPPKYPKMPKMGKLGILPKYPKNGILATAMTNTPGRLDMIIIFKITPVYPFYTLLLRVSILHFL